MTATPSLLSRRAAEHRAAAPKAPAAAPVVVVAADQKAKIAAIRDDARRRVAAAWTMAKNLLPQASNKAHQHLAAALVSAPTAILAEALRSTARMATYTKSAEVFQKETGQDLNVFVETESELAKLKGEVLTELKQDDAAKVAAAAPKTAAPGPMPGQEPGAPIPGQEDLAPEPAAAGTPEGTPDAPQGEFQEPAPAGDAAPGEMGDPGAGVDPAMPANAVGDVAVEGDLMDKIQSTENQIGEIESEVSEAGDEALDLAAIFNPEVQADKAQNLANEGEGSDMDEAEGDDFAPSNTEDMMDASDFGADQQVTDADYFKDASGPDPMAMLLGKNAGQSDVDTEPGDMDAHFETDLAGDTRDAEEDNEDLLGDVLSALDQPTMEQKRDVEPKLEEPVAPQAKDAAAAPKAAVAPKAAAAPTPKKSSIRTVGAPAAKAAASAEMSDDAIAKLLFREED